MKTQLPYDIYQKKLDKEISHRTSFMNDSKWYKFFEEFSVNNLSINGSKIKFLLEDKIYDFSIGYIGENYMDTIFGVFSFKEIEWIFIPQKYEIERFNRMEKLSSQYKENPIDKIEEAMSNLARFCYEKDENGLKIYGYK